MRFAIKKTRYTSIKKKSFKLLLEIDKVKSIQNKFFIKKNILFNLINAGVYRPNLLNSQRIDKKLKLKCKSTLFRVLVNLFKCLNPISLIIPCVLIGEEQKNSKRVSLNINKKQLNKLYSFCNKKNLNKFRHN